MTKALTPFVFQDHPVRTTLREDEPWFVAADVCRCLGIKQTSRAVEALDEDEKGVTLTHTLGGQQEMILVSESGLYTLILRSRKATTPGTIQHRFRKWITAEVIPAIRKTGQYRPQETEEENLGSDRSRIYRMQEHIAVQKELIEANRQLLQYERDKENQRHISRMLEAGLPEQDVATLLGINIKYVEYIRSTIEQP